MNLALIGYGRMGHEIEEAAIKMGHRISLIIDIDNKDDLNAKTLKDIDVVIEFSTPASAFDNICKCLETGTPVVSGTTGWLDKYDRAVEVCLQHNTSFIHSSNYSIGVNIFFKINAELAKFIAKYPSYSPHIEEIHHIKKLDAPSGTAITLSEKIADNNNSYHGWCFDNQEKEGSIPIKSIRTGDVPGTHTVSWKSDIDDICLTHIAKNRKGLAKGAVIAAEFIYNKKGVFTMDNVMGF